MKISSVATFNSQSLPHLSALVADPKQQIAFSPDLAAAMGISLNPPVTLSKGVVLQAISAESLAEKAEPPSTAKQVLDMTGHITKIGALTLSLAKSQFPATSPQLTGAIDGVEVALLGMAAAKAWMNVGDKGYTQAVLTTTSAGLELLDLVKDVIPGFDKLQPALAVVKILVKIGDEVCQITLSNQTVSKIVD